MVRRTLVNKKYYNRSRYWGSIFLCICIFCVGILIYLCRASTGIPVRFSLTEERHLLKVYDSDGKSIGTGEYVQSISVNGIVRAKIQIDLDERITLLQIIELKHNNVLQPVRYVFERVEKDFTKRYEVDFKSSHAMRKVNKKGLLYEKKYPMKFELERTFAGAMFIFVALNFPPKETEMDLNVIAFTPVPKVVPVKFRKKSMENISFGNYSVPAVRYVVQPELPLLVRLFVGNSYNNTIWLSATDRPAFLRFKGFFEPDGHFLRIDIESKKESKEKGF